MPAITICKTAKSSHHGSDAVNTASRVQSAAARYRRRQGELAAQLVDVVAGLRILNGLGGKPGHLARYAHNSAGLRDLGYRVGRASSWVGALGDGLEGSDRPVEQRGPAAQRGSGVGR